VFGHRTPETDPGEAPRDGEEPVDNVDPDEDDDHDS
jgi:hypothetical protein